MAEEYANRQQFDMEAESPQCTDPSCRRIFAHKAHTNTAQKAVRRDPA